mgnify:CR=1 FL=1
MVGTARSKVIGLDDASVRVMEENLQETFRRTAKEELQKAVGKCLAPMKQLLRQA